MGARHLSRRSLYLDGVPSGVSFPKFLKPCQIEKVKARRISKPHRGWYEIIDEVIMESMILDPDVLDLVGSMA